jgi:putative flippase GtrA
MEKTSRQSIAGKIKSAWDQKKIRYLLVGAWNTVFGYAIFALLITAFENEISYLEIAFISHLVAVTHSFFTHRQIVFKSRKNVLIEYTRFHITNLSSLAFGIIALSFFVERCSIPPLTAQAIVTTGIVAISYFAHQNFTFR